MTVLNQSAQVHEKSIGARTQVAPLVDAAFGDHKILVQTLDAPLIGWRNIKRVHVL